MTRPASAGLLALPLYRGLELGLGKVLALRVCADIPKSAASDEWRRDSLIEIANI